jgi:hypothetical protein
MSVQDKREFGATEDVVSVITGKVVPLGFQQLTSLSSAAGLTVPDGALFAVIDVEAENVRWRDDGTNPTATVGMRIIADTELVYSGDLSAIKFIAETSGAIANVSYYG